VAEPERRYLYPFTRIEARLNARGRALESNRAFGVADFSKPMILDEEAESLTSEDCEGLISLHD
jgi:hypothetical protein